MREDEGEKSFVVFFLFWWKELQISSLSGSLFVCTKNGFALDGYAVSWIRACMALVDGVRLRLDIYTHRAIA